MTAIANLPAELEIWNSMTPAERLAIMEKVPHTKSLTRRFRGCMDYIRTNLDQFVDDE